MKIFSPRVYGQKAVIRTTSAKRFCGVASLSQPAASWLGAPGLMEWGFGPFGKGERLDWHWPRRVRLSQLACCFTGAGCR